MLILDDRIKERSRRIFVSKYRNFEIEVAASAIS